MVANLLDLGSEPGSFQILIGVARHEAHNARLARPIPRSEGSVRLEDQGDARLDRTISTIRGSSHLTMPLQDHQQIMED